MNIYPVIHHITRDISMEQVDIALACGADGIFLISHHGADDEIIACAIEAKDAYPAARIGVNLLSTQPEAGIDIVCRNHLDMFWADQMGVSSAGLDPRGVYLSDVAADRADIMMFASVAFKYQQHEPRPDIAATNALAAGFIPTTSGPATGHAPDIEKIQLMSASVDRRLAIASGMTPENVSQFAPHVSHILVASGISLDDYRIDPRKLKQLIAIACRQAALAS